VPWLDRTLDDLVRQPELGYLAGGAAAAEPTALAAMAFVQSGRDEAAQKAAEALAAMQQAGGEVGVRNHESPGWPTSLAIVAWSALKKASGTRERPGQVASAPARSDREADASSSLDGGQIDRAVAWLLANRGRAVERTENFGHNTELIGWAYAEQTHSWVEPTAFGVLALKAAGKADDPASREGIAVLLDRQLPGGGLNYGNTYVLGQLLRSHVEPTGIALLALAGEPDSGGGVAKSITWLRRSVSAETTPLSLGWALLGLRAHGALPPQADDWLAGAASRVQMRDRSPHKLALLALAAKGWPA